MAEKKYFWLKLQKDFFKRHDIRIVEQMKNGKDYILFYLKLLVESIDHEGELRFSDTIPYNEEMLSVITNTNIDIVRSAMKMFQELGMIEILDNSTIYMTECAKLIGSETSVAERVRKSRALHCNKVKQICNTEKEIDIEKDKEIDIDTDKSAREGQKRNTKVFQRPTLEEVKEYINEKGYSVNAEHFIDYYTSNGWKVGRNTMKDWKAAVRTWNAKEKPNNKKGYDWDNL